MRVNRLRHHLEKTASGSRARATNFKTLHNTVTTPLFMPVATLGTVRNQPWESLDACGAQILLANTYHLLLQPGIEVFQHFGGLHNLMNWKRSVLTDSGGFQIFSLPTWRDIQEEGAHFRDPKSGVPVFLSPEKSIETQRAIGSDIMMVLDICVPSTCDRSIALEAWERTRRWAGRSLIARGGSPQALFGIVQGACFEDLRRDSARAIAEMPFDGYAIGGLAVGETRQEREDMTALVTEHLPEHAPRYLMGVGTPLDLLEGVHRGVDLFDCILPTAISQQGVAYTSLGKIELRRAVYRLSSDALDPACPCTTCTRYSRGYLHHLLKAKEPLLWQLVGHHNLIFYARLMNEIRVSILEDRFLPLYHERRDVLGEHDLENPVTQPGQHFFVTRNKAQSWSIGHVASGQIMHSVSDPLTEARALYVDQPDLPRRLRGGSELCVWDVGLGSGANLFALLQVAEATPQARLRVVSFERDVRAMDLVLANPSKFPQSTHPVFPALLKEGKWSSKDGRIRVELRRGLFEEQFKNATLPHVIWYDMFSSEVAPELWSMQLFGQLRKSLGEHPSELYTYTTSTEVRARLLATGFLVASGQATGPKTETTCAFTPEAWKSQSSRFEPLGALWLDKWSRSHVRYPREIPEEEHESFKRLILEHPQFQEPKIHA
jgi:queuine tRNA-ribosyltransferase